MPTISAKVHTCSWKTDRFYSEGREGKVKTEHLGGYPRPQGWRNIGRHYIVHTCPVSRHTRMLADELRDKRSPIRKMFEDAGYEADHWASSLEWTVKSLWEARERLKKIDPAGCNRRDAAILREASKRLSTR